MDAQRPVVVGIGEILWDFFPTSRRPGGAPANVAYHATQLGLNGIICSRIGRDRMGDELLAYLVERGLDTSAIQRDDQHPTGCVTVNDADTDHPTYTVEEDVAWDYLQPDASWVALFASTAAICYGTSAQRSPITRGAIASALAAAPTALRIYDVNLRPPWYSPTTIADSLRWAHVVKLNQEEALAIDELLALKAGSPHGLAERLREDYDVQVLCITRGAAGCLAFSATEQADRPGCEVEVADVVGAGDAFTAALTLGLLRGWPLATTVGFANEVGALVASRSGAMPTLGTEFAALRRRHECS
ncbi:MAG: carbohydrate kinase [Planctomycetota bacterium]